MNHLEYAFSPGQVANLSGVSVDLMRDWRRRDLLGKMGELQSNGRWKYSLKEVVELSIARLVLYNVPSVPHALYVADRALFSVLCKVKETDEYKGFVSDHLLIWTEGDLGNLTLHSTHINSLSEFQDCEASNAIYVNAQKTADALNDTLKNVIRYGLARPGMDGIHVPSSAT